MWSVRVVSIVTSTREGPEGRAGVLGVLASPVTGLGSVFVHATVSTRRAIKEGRVAM
jgi:hypothetical protein